MQQPPGRPPMPPYQPQGRPGVPAPGQPVPPAYGSGTNAFGAPAGPPLPPAPVRKKRNALRFLAGTCVFSAWLTLILSVGGALFAFISATGMAATASRAAQAAPTYLPSTPSPDNPFGSTPGGLGFPSGRAAPGLPDLGGVLMPFLIAASYAGAVFTLVSGIVTFLLFLGLGQACYVLLDLEEQTFRLSETLNLVVARLGAGR